MGAMLFEILRRGRGASNEPFEVGETGVMGVTNLFVDLYAARSEGALVLFDTGMDPRGRPIDRLLESLGASRADVTDVFLTHCHPDHVAGARLFPGARIHVGAADHPRLTGAVPPLRAAERWFRRILPTPNVYPTDLHEGTKEVPIGRGSAPVLVLAIPGDTPGACAFLFQQVLFVGDAFDFRGGRLRPAWNYATDDARQNLQSIAELPQRIEGLPLEFVCTAHGGPTPPGEARALLTNVAEVARAELASGSAAPA